jgi:CHAD domain-containing protein
VTSHANGGQPSPPEQPSKKILCKAVKIQWDPGKTVAANATDKLPELAKAFFTMGRVVSRNDAPLASLHRFRLCVKRFRYVLELFQPCYGPTIRRRISELRALQERLGEISDCTATEELLKVRSDLRPADRERIILNLRRLTVARVSKFQRHWIENFEPPALERLWTIYLGRASGSRR